MTPEFSAHSFDEPRIRAVPSAFSGETLDGRTVTRTLDERTLIVAIKSSCDGCHAFVHSALDELKNVPVVIVSATKDLNHEWAHAPQAVIVAPDFLAALDIRWPPTYVLIDPRRHEVVSEGVLFSPAQVAAEIARFLT